MAELNDDTVPELNDDTVPTELERGLRARIAELEALLEARTSTIVGLAAQLAEHQGTGSTRFTSARVAEAERQLAELRATKIIRYSAAPRRIYARLRGGPRA